MRTSFPLAVEREAPPTPSRSLFTLFCWASFISNIGGWMQAGAVPFIVYEMTGSPSWVGIATVATFLPSMVMTLVGGVLGDRFGKTRIVFSAQGILSITTWMLFYFWQSGSLSPTTFLLLLSLQSAALGLGVSSFQALPAELVNKGAQASAINLNSAQAQVAKAVGPALAGMVLAQFGAGWTFAANGATALIASLMLVWLHLHARLPASGRVASPFRAVAEGMVAIKTRAELRLIIGIMALSMALGAPFYQAISIIAASQLDVEAHAYGILLSLYAVGAITGNAILTRLKIPPSAVIRFAMYLWGISIAVASLSNSYAITGFATLTAGCAYLLATVTFMTRVQLLSHAALRGRIVALYSVVYIGAIPVGAFVQGFSTEYVGLPVTLGVIALGLASIGMWLSRSVRVRTLLDSDPIDIRVPGSITPVGSIALKQPVKATVD